MWLNNPIVQDAVYRRLTGQSKHWLNWVFEENLMPSQGRLLSVGCETGLHEIEIASMAPDLEIVAIEPNAEMANVASENAARFSNLTIVNDSVLNYLNTHNEKFDALLSVNYLDREASADKICASLRSALKDTGTFCVTEYVGPSYLDLAHKQEAVVDQFLSALDPHWKLSPNAAFRDSELVESIKKSGRRKNPKSIVTALEKHFEMVVKRYGGGGLLEPIFFSLNEPLLNSGSTEANNIVRLLLASEEQLTNAGVVPNHVFLGIGRIKP